MISSECWKHIYEGMGAIEDLTPEQISLGLGRILKRLRAEQEVMPRFDGEI